MKFWHQLTLIGTLVVAVLSIVALIAMVVQADPPPSATPRPAPANAGANTTGL